MSDATNVVDLFPDLVLPRTCGSLGRSCSNDEKLSSSSSATEKHSHVDNLSCPDVVNEADGVQSTTIDNNSRLESTAIYNTSTTSPIATDDINVSSANDDASLRQSSRLTKKPSYLQNYHCGLLQCTDLPTKTKFSLHDYLSYNRLSPSFKTFVVTPPPALPLSIREEM